VIDPLIFGSTPHRSPTALQDFVGQVSLIHAALIPAIIRLTGVTPRRYPIDVSANPRDMLWAIQQQHISECRALGIAAPPDLESFDLREEGDFNSWTFILSGDLARIKTAAGVV
jgi:hypothetical protein